MDNVTPSPIGAQITGTEYTVPSVHGMNGRRKGQRPKTLPTRPLDFRAYTPTTTVSVSAEAPRETADVPRTYADVTLTFTADATPEVELYVNEAIRVEVEPGAVNETVVRWSMSADMLPVVAAALAEAVKRAQSLQLDAATRADLAWSTPTDSPVVS